MPRDPAERSVEATIDALVGDLAPLAQLRPGLGLAAGLGATVLAATAVWLTVGLRADILAGHPAPIVAARAAVLLAGGLCLLVAAVRAAVPGRGDQGASLAGTLLLGLFPLGLMGLLLQGIVAGRPPSFAEVGPYSATRCLAIASVSALFVGACLIMWMRRAAPTDLPRVGWLCGWAAGALGTFAYSLFCPASSPGFVTTVYPAAMLLVAMLFRLAVPGLVRW
jgi:hypothetical protein